MNTQTETFKPTAATTYRLWSASHHSGKQEPTEAQHNRAERVFITEQSRYGLQVADYADRINYAGERRAMDARGLVDEAVARAAASEANRDAVDALRALKTLERAMRCDRALNLHVTFGIIPNLSTEEGGHSPSAADWKNAARDRNEHRVLRSAIALLEADLTERVRALSREASRIRRALK